MDNVFSNELKTIIAESRIVALELGYDYISIIHLFIADCRLNMQTSIKKFAFTSDSGFQTFVNNQRIGESYELADNLPLTKDAESVIKKAIVLWKKIYKSKSVESYHLFLAATLINKSHFNLIFNNVAQLNLRLEQYYIHKNILGDINKNFLFKIKQRFNL